MPNILTIRRVSQNFMQKLAALAITCTLGIMPYPFDPLGQCFSTFFQPRHTFLEQLTRRHTAYMALILYTRLTYNM